MSEGADEIQNGVARLKAVELRGGLAHALHRDGDRARHGVKMPALERPKRGGRLAIPLDF